MKSLRNLFVLVAMLAIPVFGQELTSDINLTVLDGSGNPISGASASVTFEPTNSTATGRPDKSIDNRKGESLCRSGATCSILLKVKSTTGRMWKLYVRPWRLYERPALWGKNVKQSTE